MTQEESACLAGTGPWVSHRVLCRTGCGSPDLSLQLLGGEGKGMCGWSHPLVNSRRPAQST